MALDRPDIAFKTGSGPADPVAPGAAVPGGLAQTWPPPDLWPRLAGGAS